MQFHSGALSTNETHMKFSFSDPYGYTDWELPQPKIPPKTPITMPQMSSMQSGSVCIFTLDWDPWTLNSQHSVPFPVYSMPRLVGRNELGNPIYEAWVFNSTYPTGVPISGKRDESKDDDASSDEKENNDDSKRHIPIGTIVSAVLGALAGFAIFATLLWKLKRRSREKREEKEEDVTAGRSSSGSVVLPESPTDSLDVPPPTYEEATRV